ncbi:MAG TPA: hypothetical protein VFF12_00480 [Myxococcaceae bacterium]|nr:hypothetical protein [Myxococcaceae bacterium]
MTRAWLLAAALAAGCATTPAVAPTFTYAPKAGTRFVRTVKLVNETTLVGSPFRQLEEQEFVWNVGFSREGENTLVTQQLQRVALRINGAELLDGERMPGTGLSVDLVVSPEPKVVDVRGTEKAAEVLTSLASPGAEGNARRMVGPEQVKELAVQRFEMVVRDVVGHPSAPGSTWVAADPDPAVKRKTMTVDRLEPCGNTRCARVSAQYDVDPRAAAKRALRFAAGFLARNGVDPGQAEVVDASLEYRDELLVEPGTLVDHGATFSQIARVSFAGPQVKEIPVEIRTSLEQSSTFP